MGKRRCHFFSAVLDRTHLILAGNDDIYGSLDEFEIWPDPTTGFHGTDRVKMEKTVNIATFSRLFFHPILFILAGNDDMHDSSEDIRETPPYKSDPRFAPYMLYKLGKPGVRIKMIKSKSNRYFSIKSYVMDAY